MNKKTILIGSLFAFVMLMLVPSIPAIEVNQVLEMNKSELIEELRGMDMDKLKDKDWNPGYLLNVLLSIFMTISSMAVFKIILAIYLFWGLGLPIWFIIDYIQDIPWFP